MARDNVISIDQSHGGARRRVSDARVYELVAACRTRIADTLPRLLQELFEHLDDELYQLADKSANDMLQTRYFDAMRELRKLREPMEKAFLEGRLKHFDAFWSQPQAAVEFAKFLGHGHRQAKGFAVAGARREGQLRYLAPTQPEGQRSRGRDPARADRPTGRKP